MALFLKKVEILCIEKVSVFTVTLSWGRSFEKTNSSIFMKFGSLMFFWGVECNDVVFEVMRLKLGSLKASQHEEKSIFQL